MNARLHYPVRPVPALKPILSRAPSHLVQRTCACGGTAGPSGECASCARKRALAQARSGVTPRLLLGPTDDQHEREARRIAENLIGIPAPASPGRIRNESLPSRTPDLPPPFPRALPATGSGERDRVRRQEDDEAVPEEEEDDAVDDVDGLVARRAAEGASALSTAAPLPASVQTRLDSARGRGEPMSPLLRRFFEPALGHDFSRVRIHDDGAAADLARELQAKAFTVGQDIFFAQGQFQAGGRKLIAHELVHTLQQSGSGPVESKSIGAADGMGLVRREPDDSSGTTEDVKPTTPTPCPTSVSLGAVTHRNHGDLSKADQEAYRTYLSAKTTMNVGPGPDHTGHCMKEYLTPVSNDCPPEVYTRKKKSGEVVESQPCVASICLDINRFGSGPTAFIDEHKTKVPDSVLEVTGKSSCKVVCDQVYKCDRTQATTGKFRITRNYQAGSATRSDGSTMHITTGRVDKTTLP